jgi:hypothetical protein
MIFIRPESLSVADGPSQGDNRLTATIANEEFEGQSYHVYLEGPKGPHSRCRWSIPASCEPIPSARS